MGRESNQGDSSSFNPWSTAVTIFTGGENISDEGYVDNGRGYNVAFITELF